MKDVIKTRYSGAEASFRLVGRWQAARFLQGFIDADSE
jgi:hypothetical protein